MLRCRADELRQLASAIERSSVMVLADATDSDLWATARAQLCDRMLLRNLHQLHVAADQLRQSALRLCVRADALDRGARVA